MKKIFAFLLTLMLFCTALPTFAAVKAPSQRTEKLDLTGINEATANEAEGWSFDPTGDDGNPLLVLTDYGTESAHSAPILCPKNTKIVVNGDCYVDNAVLGSATNVISGTAGGYLKIEGIGTLNVYANQYAAYCICSPMGVVTNGNHLYINDITVNCFGSQITSTNSSKSCIYASHNIEIRNATVNTTNGAIGIEMQGRYVTGAHPPETDWNQLLIENSTVNVQNHPNGNLWSSAKGLVANMGRITIAGDSNVTISAGSQSIYTTICLAITGGNVSAVSTPGSTADTNAIVYVKRMDIGADVQSVYFATTKYPLSKAYYCQASGTSTLADGPVMEIGTFANGTFAPAADPNNNNLSTLKIVRDEPAVTTHTVSFFGYGDELIETVEVEDGTAAVAPTVDRTVQTGNGTFVFYGWNMDFSNVTEDMEVYALYTLLGDVDLNGVVNSTDALLVMRYSMTIISLSARAFAAGDMNGDGSVNATDAINIMRSIAAGK